MSKALRVLLVEDSEDDCELLIRELRRSGYEVDWMRVDTAPAMRAALQESSWDIILSDYSMPGFDAPGAIAVLKESGLDLPLLIVSGTVGEETAVDALKAGAGDFLVKGRLARLAPAIDRELREVEVRRRRRAVEEALRTSELKYRRIVETAQEGIWLIDEQARTTYVNQRMAAMLATTAPELLGVSMLELMDDEWREIARAKLARQRQGASEQFELKLRRRDGRELWALLSTSPVMDDAGGYAGGLAMVADVTEQRKLQTQLMVSDRMAAMGMLAAGVAHEINNPLASVIANLELAAPITQQLKSPTGDGGRQAELAEHLQDARESAERVRSIVQDLKLFSRAQEDKRERVDVRRALDSSIRMAWNEIRHRAKLVREYGEVPAIDANESRLCQVFLNLLINAAQAIPEGQADRNEIRVSALARDQRVVVEVCDTGSGMSQEVLQRLFTPFFTTKPIGVGTGLGLSICHRIVSALGGEISVQSQVGAGSAFKIALPFAKTVASERPSTRTSVHAVEGRRGRVLVVDDEPMMLKVVQRALSSEHEVVVTLIAQEGLDMIAGGERFDVILCDLMMPRVTGMDFHAELLRTAPEQARRIVFLTGGAFTARTRAFLDEVDNPRLEKPFELTALRALVNESMAQNGQ